MKKFLTKYLFLNYHSKIAGKDFYILRASTVIVPVFCLVVFTTLLTGLSWIFWLVFLTLIICTFPIVKSTFINWGSFIATSVLIILASNFDYDWWEPIPLYYFSAGILMDRTRFLLFSVKYSDLQDWEQKLQYLRLPDSVLDYDETEPELAERLAAVSRFEELEEQKYGARDNVNILPAIVTFGSILLLIILLLIFREHIQSFPDRRFF